MEQQLTEQEVQDLKNLQKEYAIIIAELGQVEVSILLLKKQIEKLEKEKKDPLYESLLSIQQIEQKIAKELTNKYGDGKIDLELGKISSF